jgi:phospholipid/cholesterol/gamma-HCH transport system permease protein
MLVFLADIMALAGGAVALWLTIDISLHAFLTQLYEIIGMKNFLSGMAKTPFFAMAIGLVGCFQGFRATGSAESVGLLTTISVVQSIFLVILLDALFAIFFSAIKV